MNIDINSISFSVNINGLYDEIMQKMTELSNIEVEFMKKYQHKLSDMQLHASMVFFLRNALNRIQEIFRDVRGYFQDLDLAFVYQLFRKIYLFVLTGYNYTAQAFSISFSEIKSKNEQKTQKNDNGRKASTKTRFDPYKKMQEMEYYINSIEIQQERINRQIVEMYDKALQHRGLVEKMKPSTAIKQISQIKDNVETIINNAQSTFEEAYMQKYKNFKNYVAKIGKPQDVGQAFTFSMGQALRDRFMQGMTKIAFKIKEFSKQEIVAIQKVDQSIQTDKINTQNKNKNIARQDKNLDQKFSHELENLRKAQISTAKENAQSIRKLKLAQQSHSQLKRNYQALKSLLATRNNDYDSLKLDSTWVIEQKQKLIEKLSSQINSMKNHKFRVQMGIQANTNIFCSVDMETQTQAKYLIANIQSQMIEALKSTNERVSKRLSLKESKIKQLQKELQASSGIKIQFTDAINTLCAEMNMDHLMLSNTQLPSLPKLIQITSAIFNTFRADRDVKNLLIDSVNRCSIEAQQHDFPQQERKGSLRRRNAKASIIIRPSGKLIHNNSQKEQNQKTNIRRRSFVDFLSIGCQTEFISDRMTNILNQMQNCTQIEVQTQITGQISNKKERFKNNEYSQRAQGNTNQQKRGMAITTRPKTRQTVNIRRQSHQKSAARNQTEAFDYIGEKKEKLMPRSSKRKQVKTAQNSWRQKFKMIKDQDVDSTEGFKNRKYMRQRQTFQMINLDQKKQLTASIKVPAEQIKHWIQYNKQNRQVKSNQITNKIEKLGSDKLIKKAQGLNLSQTERQENDNLNQSQQGVQSLFKVKRIFNAQDYVKAQSPKMILESVRRLKKTNKIGYKEVVFNLLQSSNQRKVDKLLSTIIMDNSNSFQQALLGKMNS